MDTDEFEITATHPSKEARVWTRSTYHGSKFIADGAIRLGYDKAVVVNTFGGHRSDVLYEVVGIHKVVSHSRDHVAEERNASHHAVDAQR